MPSRCGQRGLLNPSSDKINCRFYAEILRSTLGSNDQELTDNALSFYSINM